MFRYFAIILVFVMTNVLAGCSDVKEAVVGEDLPEDQNNRNIDVEFDNAEFLTLGLLRSAYQTHRHLRFYDYLDAADLSQAAIDQQDAFDEIACPGVDLQNTYFINGNEVAKPAPGHVAVVISRNQSTDAFYDVEDASQNVLKSIPLDTAVLDDEPLSGEKYKVGDRVNVIYNGCIDEEGVTHNGELTLEYEEIKGLNDRFSVLTTEQCLVDLIEKYELDLVPIQKLGESLTLVPNGRGQSLYVDEEDSGVIVYPEDRKAIVLNSDGVTSVDGDRVYSMIDRDLEEHNCQAYERTIDADIHNLSAIKGDVEFVANGTGSIIETSLGYGVVESQLSDATVDFEVKQNNTVDEYAYVDLVATRTQVLSNLSTTFGVTGEATAEMFRGTGRVAVVQVYDDYVQEYPYRGVLSISGRGLESVNVLATDQEQLSIRVDFDGDSDGDGQLDFDDDPIDTTWTKILNREFILAE